MNDESRAYLMAVTFVVFMLLALYYAAVVPVLLPK